MSNNIDEILKAADRAAEDIKPLHEYKIMYRVKHPTGTPTTMTLQTDCGPIHLTHVATIEAESPNDVWIAVQHHNNNDWTKDPMVSDVAKSRYTHRSMMVGDALWEEKTTTLWMCKDQGWSEVKIKLG